MQAVALLPLLAATADRVWIVFLVAGVQAVLRQINNPASFALLPRVVSDEQLVAANAAFAAGGSISRLVGAPLGGVAVGLGGLDAVVAIDAVSFVAVAIAIAGIAPVHSTSSASDEVAGSGGVREGWLAIRSRPVLVGYLVVQSLAQLAFAMFPVLFITFVVEELDGDGTDIGVIRGSAAFGALGASLLIQRYGKALDPRRLMLWGYATFAVVAALFINAPSVTHAMGVYLALFALSGLPNAASQIGSTATAQRFCPSELRGRLSGLADATGAAAAAVGTIGIGLLVDRIDVIGLFNSQAAVFLACAVCTYVFVIRPSTDTDDGRPDQTRVALQSEKPMNRSAPDRAITSEGQHAPVRRSEHSVRRKRHSGAHRTRRGLGTIGYARLIKATRGASQSSRSSRSCSVPKHSRRSRVRSAVHRASGRRSCQGR